MFEEKIVSVGELRQLFMGDQYDIEIDTPDGFQPVTAWFDKGRLPLVEIRADDGSCSRCATDHLVQRSDQQWITARELVIGDEIITRNGTGTVTAIADGGVAECYDFQVDHPNHRYWADDISSHNSGKSYIVSGNIVRDALRQGVYVILIDTEDALRETWMRNLGVNTDDPNLTKEVWSTVNQISKVIKDYTEDYIETYKETPREEQPKVLFVIDSLGMVQTDAEIEQFEKAELKGDKGIKAKALKMLVANCIRLFAGYEIGMVATNHVYKSQDQYHPDDVISGGSSFVYASSIVVSMNKKKLRDDEKSTIGIISKVKCIKTRFSKPFEEVEIHIPYEQGMDPYSGLFDMFEGKVLLKEGNRYVYTSKDGTQHKLFRKHMTPEFFDMIMREWSDDRVSVAINPESDHQEIEDVE
jgi:RecA/RadA recombinase